MDRNAYEKDLEYINSALLPWDKLFGKTILIAGASGLIGSTFVDALIYRNENYIKEDVQKIKLILISRSRKSLENRFNKYKDKGYIKIIEHNVINEFDEDQFLYCMDTDYIIHAASKGDPVSFVKDPVSVMNSNYMGTLNLLTLLKKVYGKKLVFISSGEIYGKIDNISEGGITEEQSGYIDIANFRNCYPVSKRAGENLCICFAKQYGVRVNIARLCHTYGGNIMQDENRVIFQFIKDTLNGQDIALKSSGIQKRSYCYTADAVKGLFYVLLKGKDNEIYNVANKNSIISVRGLAETIAVMAGRKVKYIQPDDDDKKGDSGITYAVLNADKLENLGFQAEVGINEGIIRTMESLGIDN